MATAIRTIPTLVGEDAERFERLAKESEKNAGSHSIAENIKLLKEFLNKQNLL